jgi:fumarylacetoacetase
MRLLTEPLIDDTHEPALCSWVTSANDKDCDFPVQNLPLGRFRPVGEGDLAPVRVGVAIGDQILDLRLAADLCPWSEEIYPLLQPLAQGDLMAFMALGRPAWRKLRLALSMALTLDSEQGPFLESCLVAQKDAVMQMPCRVGDYTDFYSGIHHARRVGALFRPDEPLLPNYKFVPIGYHGRASSVGIEDMVIRPNGQMRSSGDQPHFGACKRLDYELELGLWIGAGNTLGLPVSMAQAEDKIFGVSLLNDWSARDIQAWEYQPLGPFLAKSFATSVSPWVVSWQALAPYRRPFERPTGDPEPLPYLDGDFNRQHGAIDMTLEVWLQTARMRKAREPAVRLSQSNLRDAAYWTAAQLIAHHTSNGCNLQVGDLLGTGTLSGPLPEQSASLLELTQGGKAPLTLPNGEAVTFLQDGDTVTLRGYCEAPGAARIGLGHVTAMVLPSLAF